MANNHVQFRWSTKPTTGEIQNTIQALGQVSPKPIIKINVQMRDIPHGAQEALLAMCGELNIDAGVTLTAVHEEGRQLTFWNPAAVRADATC